MCDIPYLAAVGSLMYVSMATHPDITYAMNKLGQFNSNPGLPHWTVVQQVLHYLKQTHNHALMLGSMQEICLTGYMDSDFAGCTNTRHSTSGYIFTLGNGPIYWSLKQQTLVTISTCEAEYVVSCHTMKETIWLRCLLKILSHKQSTTTIHSENASSIALMKDTTFHMCSKHIDIQFHYT